MRLTREVKTGILAIGAILLFIFGYSYLKGTNLLEKNRTFYVKYDNVEGLALAAPVTINGLVVGKVTDIGFVTDSNELFVEFSIEQEDFQFSKQSIANIYSTGLIGGKSLSIIPEYASGDMAIPGDTLKGSAEDGMLAAVKKALGSLEGNVSGTLATMDSLLISFTKLMDEETRLNLQSTIRNMNATMGSLNGASKSLDGLLKNNSEKLDRTFTNLDEMSMNMSQFSDSLAKLETGRLIAEFQDVVIKFNAIATGLENGEGSAGKLLKDDKLYENLEGASKQLEQLLQDVKLNPKRYIHLSVFGKKNKEYETPEDTQQ